MKEIINVEIKTRNADFSECKTDLLATGMFSDTKGLDKLNAELNEKLGGAIEKVIKLGDFKGKEGTSAIVYGNEEIGAKRLLLVGLGDKKEVTLDTVRKAAANAAKKSVEIKAENLSMAIHRAFDKLDLAAMGRAIAEGTYFGSYRYDEFVTESKNGRIKSLNAEVIDPDKAKITKLDKGLVSGIIIGKAQSYARTLANRPANIINPEALAEEAKKTAKATAGLTCTILDEKQMAAKGMG
jgi:leucyl aminopeptidase